MYADILTEINARPSEPLSAFKRGELCKVGSNCLRIISRRTGRVQTECLYADGSTGGGYDLAPDVKAIRISRKDVDETIAARKAEDVKPFNILNGLAPALNTYLAAVQQLDRE